MGMSQTDLVASEGNLISRLIDVERAVRALERQQLEVNTLSTLGSDLGAVYVGDGAAVLDENGIIFMQAASIPAIPSGYLGFRPSLTDGVLYIKDDQGNERRVLTAADLGVHVLVSNVSTKTTIYSTSIPANALGTDGFIDIQIPFRYLNNTGANATLTLTVDWGSETPMVYASPNIAGNAEAGVGIIHVRLSNAGVTDSQRLHFAARLSAPFVNGATIAPGGTFDVVGGNWPSQDTTSAKTLTLSVTLSSATHLHNFRTLGALVSGPFAL